MAHASTVSWLDKLGFGRFTQALANQGTIFATGQIDITQSDRAGSRVRRPHSTTPDRENRIGRCGVLRCEAELPYGALPNTRVPLVPPKPNEFFTA